MVEPRIERSRRSSLSIHIDPSGNVVVKAPRLIPNFVIKQFIKEKEDWIHKTLKKIENKKPLERKYKDGELFLFLGKQHALQIYNGTKVGINNGKLYLPNAVLFRAEKELVSWYKNQAQEIILKRLAYHAEKMGARYNEVLFSDTKSKWGTCFPDNSLQFNWRLVMTPLMVLDYVVIHELTHTTEKNHSDTFWRRVKLFTPAYKQHRKWLEDNAHLLTI